MKAAYFNCIGGVSGDMVLGALVDAGLSPDTLRSKLSKLDLQGYEIEAVPDSRAGISGTRVTVRLSGSAQPRRNLDDILSLISQSGLSTRVKRDASRVFNLLAEAEARVHGLPANQVHFHEVGAVDAIVDIVGAACGLEALRVEKVYCSPIPPGSGYVNSEHGTLPVPAPATVQLMALAQAPFAPAAPHAPRTELSTPTGVAILTALAEFSRPEFSVEKSAHGIGQKDMGAYANVLGLWLGEVSAPGPGSRTLLVIETNIDDMNPEVYPYLLERLFQAGARDAWLTPIHMKKGRPATIVSVLADPSGREAMVRTLLRETTTLGVRVREVVRYEAKRRIETVNTSLGPVRVKVKLEGGVPVSLSPEHEDCAAVAASANLPLVEVYRIVTQEASALLLADPADSPGSGR